MLEVAPYGLTGLVAILVVAFCFACTDSSAPFSDKRCSRSVDDTNSAHPNYVERSTCTADTDAGLTAQEHKEALNG
jgi:hypothetical protein